jgi:hypothetical protein
MDAKAFVDATARIPAAAACRSQSRHRVRAMSYSGLGPGTRMARIDLQPTWVGVLDFQKRLPSALGGIS